MCLLTISAHDIGHQRLLVTAVLGKVIACRQFKARWLEWKSVSPGGRKVIGPGTVLIRGKLFKTRVFLQTDRPSGSGTQRSSSWGLRLCKMKFGRRQYPIWAQWGYKYCWGLPHCNCGHHPNPCWTKNSRCCLCFTKYLKKTMRSFSECRYDGDF